MPKKKAGAYVIMLDHWMEIFPDGWPITASRATLERINAISSYDGRAPSVLPKTDTPKFVKNKSLKNTKANEVESGGIYLFD